MSNEKRIKEVINSSIRVKSLVLEDEAITNAVSKIVDAVIHTFRNGHKVLFCGNGGSAADAQHLSTELSSRLYLDRPPLDAEALHVNTSYLTATANDYSFEDIFSRLVLAKGHKGDILFGLSTSGKSPNVVKAMQTAKDMGFITVGMTGSLPGPVDTYSDLLIKIPSTDTPRIQEAHILLGHIICELVEQELFGKKG